MVAPNDLNQAMEPLLDGDERLLGAFTAIRGVRPGMEAIAGLPFTLLLVLTGNVWVAAVFGVVTYLGIALSRTFVIVGLTTRSVVRADTGRRRLPRPDSRITRLGRDVIAPPDRLAGDPKVRVNGIDYWVTHLDSDEAVRLAKLARQ